MGNAVKFIELYKNKTFKEFPYCISDILVFSLLSYANIEDKINDKQHDYENDLIPLKKFYDDKYKEYISNRFLVPKEFANFFKKAIESKRYSHIKITKILNVFSEEHKVQFFAFTIVIDECVFVLFRGTDRTINGWKENFDMVLQDKIPSQKIGAKYLKEVIDRFDGKKIIVIGHSKGGNIAYYSYFNLSLEDQNKVTYTFNLDGPGFKEDNYDYKDYGAKYLKIVPEDDVIGILFDVTQRHKIVKCNKVGFYAHDVLTWQLDRKTNYTTLLETKELTFYSDILRYSMYLYYRNLDPVTIKILVEFIIDIIDQSKTKDVLMLARDVIKFAPKYIKEIKENNKEQSDFIIKQVKNFIKVYFYCATHYKEVKTEFNQGHPSLLISKINNGAN